MEKMASFWGWMRALREKVRQYLGGKNPVYYINSPQVLPAPLKKEEEERVFRAILQGDDSAREPLITHNLRLVVYIARKFDSPGASTEDLISIGTIGLIKGISTFRSDKGVRLATYCARCIENAILSQMRLSGKSG